MIVCDEFFGANWHKIIYVSRTQVDGWRGWLSTSIFGKGWFNFRDERAMNSVLPFLVFLRLIRKYFSIRDNTNSQCLSKICLHRWPGIVCIKYNFTTFVNICFGRSLIRTVNKRGSKMDLWGTPWATDSISDLTPSEEYNLFPLKQVACNPLCLYSRDFIVKSFSQIQEKTTCSRYTLGQCCCECCPLVWWLPKVVNFFHWKPNCWLEFSSR